MHYGKSILQTLLLALSLLSWVACERSDNTEPTGAYSQGVFIVHEGAFNGGTGTVSHYDRSTRQVQNDIFGRENGGAALGNIAQSMYVHREKGYVVINNAAKIEIVDANTFVRTGQISGLAQPRFLLPVGDAKAYVTQWGPDGLTGSIAVIDLNTNTITKTIPVGAGPERPVRVGNRVYVPLSGGFGRDKRVAIVDLSTDAVVKYVEVGDNPGSVVADASGAVWVLSRGYTDFANAANNTKGGLYNIRSEAAVGTPLELANGASNLVTGQNTLYFTAGGKTYSLLVGATTPKVLAERSFYALDIDPVTGNLWAADAKDFVKDGAVVIFKPDGTLVETLAVGLIPTDFWFLDK